MANLMQMTRGCEYAVATIACVASQPKGAIVSSDAIAACANIPRQFASNILGQLAKAGLLSAHRGAIRGYSLARPASEISVLDVIEAYDGPFIKPGCLMDRTRRCWEDNPCPLHSAWHSLKDSAREVFSNLTLEEFENKQYRAVKGPELRTQES